MSAILDQGSPLFASCAVLIVSLLLELRLRGALSLSLVFLPLLGLAVVYVPATLLFANLFARLGSLSVVFQRDYSPLLTCAAMAWAAVNIPIVVAAWILPFPFVAAIAIPAVLYFVVLMFFAVRTVLGAENRAATAVVSVSWLPLLAAPVRLGPPDLSVGVAHFAISASFRFFLSAGRVR